MRRRLALAAVAALLVVGGAACGSDDDDEVAEDEPAASDTTGTEATTTVGLEAKDISFTPTELELEAGDAVIEVENTGQLLHNLTIEDLDIDQDVAGGESIEVPVSAEAGTYTFVCKYHVDQMTGTITVG